LKGIWVVPVVFVIIISIGISNAYALPPDKITDLSLSVVSGTQVDLSWSTPADNGSPITGYKIKSKVNGVVSTIETSFGDASTSSYSDTSLSAGDVVTYRIAVINADGQGPFSNIPAPVTLVTVPDAVTDLTLTVISGTQVDLQWSEPFDGGSPILGYKIVRSLNGVKAPLTTIPPPQTSYSDTTLSPGDTVTYGVLAVNDVGRGLISNIPAPVTLVTVPSKITDLIITVASDSQVDLTWSTPYDGSSPISDYIIDRILNGNLATIETNYDPTATSYSDTTLSPGNEVQYRIAAINTIGTALYGNIPDTVMTSGGTVPEKITDLSVSGVSGSEVYLSWSTPYGGGPPITGYIIDRLLNGILTTIETNYDPSAIFYLDTTLSPGNEVQYRIAAINTIGTALYGNIPAPVITLDPEPLGELKLTIFSPSELIEEIVNDRLNSDDYVASFLIPLLLDYPEFNQNIISYSIPTTITAIDDAIQNNFDVVSYDNEEDNDDLSTPPEELIDPAMSTNEAVTLIKDAGLISSVTPTKDILLEEYLQVDWSQVDILVLQLQPDTTQEIIDITNLVSLFVRSQGDTEIYLQVNPQFADVAIIGDRVELVRDRIDGVSILCFEDDGCDAGVFSDLLGELGR